MKIFKLNLLFLITLSLFSCSNSKLKVSSKDSFRTINFPDGSFAYLNKNSSIEYDTNFSVRKVKHKGEVFYEVKKGNNPFIVETESGEIKVLGTKFNVKETKNNIEVEVESGSVELKIDKLVKKVNKGQKAVFIEVEKEIKLSKADLKHKQWINHLEKDFKKLGKEFVKESEKLGKEVKKEFRNLKKKLDK